MVKSFKGDKTVEFEDGSEVEEADLMVWATGYQASFPYFDQSGDSMFHGLLDIYARRSSISGAGGCKAFGPLFQHCISAREPHLMFAGLLERAVSTGLSKCVPAMLIASVIGGYVSFEGEYLLKEAEKELEWFREKDSTLMRHGQCSQHFTLNSHLQALDKVMGLDSSHSKEMYEMTDTIADLLMGLLMQGRFKAYKEYDFIN